MSTIINAYQQNSYFGNNGTNSTRTQPVSDPVTQSLNSAQKRIDQQKAAVDVQVSAFGKIKSSFADLQSNAKTLSAQGPNATPADISKAAENFVKAFNSATQATSSAINNKAADTLTNDYRARTAAKDLSNNLASNKTTDDLKKIGISVTKEGTLAFDKKTFDTALSSDPNAVKATLATFGRQVEKSTTQELTGNVNNAVDNLAARAKSLAKQQATQKNLSAAALDKIQQENLKFASNSARGIEAYKSYS